MGFDKIRKYYSAPVNIVGNNLGTVESVNFDGLYSNNGDMALFADEPEMREQIRRLEGFTEMIYDKAESYPVRPLTEQGGKVVLREGLPYHLANQSLETLSSISVGGILASEWFGKLESENEGRFCAFLNRVVNPENAQGFRTKNVTNKLASKRNCAIYFDDRHPIMNLLLQLDYFEYEQIKRTRPEDLSKHYSPEIIELFDTLIEPLSKGGRNMHSNPKLPFYDWLAIPGGVPACLINGICIHSSCTELTSNLDELSKMFPNATIFDETQKVLVSAKEKNVNTAEPGMQ